MVACQPCLLALLLPPSPDPLPGGKGGIYSFLMQGASPLASPRLSRKRHGLNLRGKYPEGARPLCRLLTLPLALLLPPSPRPPSPPGKGGDYKLILPGAPPPAPRHQTVYGTDSHCHRCARRGACLFGRRLALPPRYPAGDVPSLPPADAAFSLFVCPHPPDPLPSGKGEIFSFFYARGFAPCIPGGWAGRGTGSTSVSGTRRGACPFGRRFAPAAMVPSGGACRLCRLPILPLAYLSAPIPPTPFPAGRGRL